MYFPLLATACLFSSLQAAAQTNSTDSLLVRREVMKWEAANKGEFGKYRDWFAAGFFNIGYMPDSSVNRFQDGSKVLNPGQDPSKKYVFPKASFTVHDFHVVPAGSEAKLVTYIADGPLHLFVTSTWVQKDNDWKTVFYQATAYRPLQH